MLKSLSKALGFEIEKTEEKPYNPEFVAMILKGQEELRQGKGIRMTMEELKKQIAVIISKA